MIKLAHLLVLKVAVLGSLLGQGMDVMFVLETSQGTEQTIGLIRPRDLQDSDRAGVIGFIRSAQTLQPLTESREELAAALRRAGKRLAIGLGGRQVTSNLTVNIAGAIKEACAEFAGSDVAERKRAIILFFANEDPRMSAQVDSLKTALGAAKARLFVVVIQRVSERDVSRGSSWASYPFPVMAAEFLSQLAAGSGGRIYRRNWDLKAILTEARKP